jgi:hypothetical protein
VNDNGAQANDKEVNDDGAQAPAVGK